MKHLLLASSGALFLAAVSCAQNGPAVGTASGGATGSGGSSSGSGGSNGSGGSSNGTGGSSSTGTGGSGTGGDATGTGGTSSGTGGNSSGSGGSVGSGGGTASGGNGSGGRAAGGGTATGGTGGAGGAGDVSVDSIVKSMDGFMWLGQCSDGSASSLDCPLNPEGSTACPNPNAAFATKGLFRTVTHNVGGTTNTKYTINFEVRGVVGTRCYTGGKIRTTALSADPESNNDGWYVGGTPVDSKWNTYEIHVSPPVAGSGALSGTEDIYFLNAFPYPAITYGSDTYCEAHETFPMKYTASFPVMGGGTIKMVLHDSNCLGQMNCNGPHPANCNTHRSVDLTGLSPQPATVTALASLQQPYKQTNGFYPQWLYFDVKSVTSP